MAREVRIFGSPGTGKTSRLVERIGKAAEAFGPEAIMACSFTRTAATELLTKLRESGVEFPGDRGGTLHSVCHRAIEKPTILETKAYLKEWNKWNKERGAASDFLLSESDGPDIEEPSWEQNYGTDGDVTFGRMQTLRARMVPVEQWPESARAFLHRWTDWKTEAGGIDFTDMIELALRNVERAPGHPSVGFFDEVQDFTALELAVVRKWAESMEYLVLAGDDDQCIYVFKGATPDAFLSPSIPDRDKEVLPESHRVPRAVHAVADRLVRQLTRREPKLYKPRDFEGSVRLMEATYKAPERVIEDAMKRLEEFSEHVAMDGTRYMAPKTVMILTSCSMMLDPLKALLRKEGIPFANPWRRRRGDWNPLARGRGVSTPDRLLAYLRPQFDVWGEQSRMWTPEDLRRWTDLVKASGVLAPGLKTQLQTMEGEDPIENIILLMAWIQGEGFERAMAGDLDWLEQSAMPSKAGPMEYPLAVARKRSPLALMETPRLFIGTIHSVKGAEADVVYVFPDLSRAGKSSWDRVGEGRDSVIRQMYVAFTRAREELVLCGQATPFAVPWSAVA